MTSISTMRLYGGAIAVVSGGYSVFASTAGMGMTTSAWFMLGLGAVVLLHGVVLFTPAAERLGSASGPLMLAYSVLMLLNQLLLSTDTMDGGMGSGMGSGTMGMGYDPGMVAIALLMLASGAIMTSRREMM